MSDKNSDLANAFAKQLEELSNTLGSFDDALAQMLRDQDEAEDLFLIDN
jgi:hypothetical protein